jgi:hypothetical protein
MEISVTRALVELKRFQERIENAILHGRFVDRTIGHDQYKKVSSNMSVGEAIAKIQASFDKIDSLISNREKIKAAIVLSNAATLVTVLGRTMTVAEAIELKSTVSFRQMYLNNIRNQFTLTTNAVDKANTELEASITASLNTIYGNEKGKVEPSMYSAISQPQKQQKESALLDPCNVASRIEKLTDEISQMNSEIDFVLSESNAKTVISVDLTSV